MVPDLFDPVGGSARPSVYRLRTPDGVEVPLDLTVYLGRDPSVPRIAMDRRVRLVSLPSAGKEVSATHLEVRLSGETVVATDMRSTNGSIVTIPGSAPHTLLRGESAVITPGTLIDVGDGNILELVRAKLDSAPTEGES
ncbi:MAG TPA: FHA domain-containing protein [Pseudolysinimonas sp.]|nr:FHA domain-containing protein [Pseudolysinimonas sp.]